MRTLKNNCLDFVFKRDGRMLEVESSLKQVKENIPNLVLNKISKYSKI
jgi:hypothetical protein